MRFASIALGLLLVGCLLVVGVALAISVGIDPTAPFSIKVFFGVPVLLLLFLLSLAWRMERDGG